MEDSKFIHESLDYDHFFVDYTDNYYSMPCIQSTHSTNENTLNSDNHHNDTQVKHRTTGIINTIVDAVIVHK